IAAATILLTLKGVPESKDPKSSPHIDWQSGALAAMGLGGLTYAFIQAPVAGWATPDVLGSLIGGVVVLGIFVFRQYRTKSPMVPPELFKSKTFSGANGLTFLLYGALAGSLFFLPFNL